MYNLESPLQSRDCLSVERPLLALGQRPPVHPLLVVLDGPVVEVHQLLPHGVLEQGGEVLEEVHHVGPLEGNTTEIILIKQILPLVKMWSVSLG